MFFARCSFTRSYFVYDWMWWIIDGILEVLLNDRVIATHQLTPDNMFYKVMLSTISVLAAIHPIKRTCIAGVIDV